MALTYEHHVCLCNEDEDLDITITSNLEDKEEAIAAVVTSLLAREVPMPRIEPGAHDVPRW